MTNDTSARPVQRIAIDFAVGVGVFLLCAAALSYGNGAAQAGPHELSTWVTTVSSVSETAVRVHAPISRDTAVMLLALTFGGITAPYTFAPAPSTEPVVSVRPIPVFA